MDANKILMRRLLWWLVGSLGVTGIAIIMVVLMLGAGLLGALISASDSKRIADIPIPDNVAFDVPALFLPIYLDAAGGEITWARLAAIHKVTNEFGSKQPMRSDAIGILGFPRQLWDAYHGDGDRDGRMDEDNPYDAIPTLSRYLQQDSLTADEALQAWFLNEADVGRVLELEQTYLAALWVPQGWVWPVPGFLSLSSPFGYRTDPVTGAPSTLHRGIDIPAPRGTPVLAVEGGQVIQTVKSNTGYGNMIRLQHGGGTETRYAHLADIGVRRGQSVSRGEVLGWVGSTGKSTGPHLHFEVLVGGEAVDPMQQWMEPE